MARQSVIKEVLSGVELRPASDSSVEVEPVACQGSRRFCGNLLTLNIHLSQKLTVEALQLRQFRGVV